MTNSTQADDESRFQQLLASLQDPEPEIFAQAADALGKAGDARAIDPLFDALVHDDDPDVRGSAAAGLLALGHAGTQRISDMLSDKDADVRGNTILALWEAASSNRISGDSMVERLHDILLNDPSMGVRRIAADVLRMLGHWSLTSADVRNDAYVSHVYASHHQFLIGDSLFDGNTGDDFWGIEPERRLAVNPPGLIGINTKSYDMVSYVAEVYVAAPTNDVDDWDHVEEASLEVLSGGVTIAGLFIYRPGKSAPQVLMQPGTYRVRVYCGNLDNGVYKDDDDYYRIVLWPAPFAEPRVLRAYQRA